MKKIFIFFVISISFVGCKVQYPNLSGGVRTRLPYPSYQEFVRPSLLDVDVVYFDFTKYNELGFYFTPNTYNNNHDVLGIIRVELHPSVIYIKSTEIVHDDFHGDAYYGSTNKKMVQRVGDLDWYSLLDEIYNLSINMGGDGFTNFLYGEGSEHAYITYKFLFFKSLSETASWNYLIVEGVVIRRNG